MSPVRDDRVPVEKWPTPYRQPNAAGRVSTAGDLLPRPPEWTERAACAGLAPLFDQPYSDEDTPAWRARRREAVAVCGTCPVLRQCREYAAENDLTGVWGGRAHGSQHKVHSAAYPADHITSHPFLIANEGTNRP